MTSSNNWMDEFFTRPVIGWEDAAVLGAIDLYWWRVAGGGDGWRPLSTRFRHGAGRGLRCARACLPSHRNRQAVRSRSDRGGALKWGRPAGAIWRAFLMCAVNAMTQSTYTSDLIAARLHALINSRPRSPTLAEITNLVEAVQYEQAEAQSWPVDKIGLEIRDAITQTIALEAITPDGDHNHDETTAAAFLGLDRNRSGRGQAAQASTHVGASGDAG